MTRFGKKKKFGEEILKLPGWKPRRKVPNENKEKEKNKEGERNKENCGYYLQKRKAKILTSRRDTEFSTLGPISLKKNLLPSNDSEYKFGEKGGLWRPHNKD